MGWEPATPKPALGATRILDRLGRVPHDDASPPSQLIERLSQLACCHHAITFDAVDHCSVLIMADTALSWAPPIMFANVPAQPTARL